MNTSSVKPTCSRRLSHRLQNQTDYPEYKCPKGYHVVHREKHDKKNPYTVISNKPINDDNLSAEALGVLTYLMSKPDNWTIWKSQIAHRFGMGRHKTNRIFKELEEAGYMFEEQSRQSWGGYDFSRRVLFEASQLLDSAKNDDSFSNAVAENPHAENPHAENQHLVSNHVSAENTEEKKSPKPPFFAALERGPDFSFVEQKEDPKKEILEEPKKEEICVVDLEEDEIEAYYQQGREELMARFCPGSESEAGQARWAEEAKKIVPVDAEALVKSGAVKFPLPPENIPASRYWSRAGMILAIPEAELFRKASCHDWDYRSMRMFLHLWKKGKINPPRIRRWVRSPEFPEEPLVQVLRKIEKIMTGEDYVGNFKFFVHNLRDDVERFCFPDRGIVKESLICMEDLKKAGIFGVSAIGRAWLVGVLCHRLGMKGKGIPWNQDTKDMYLESYALDAMAQFSADEFVRDLWFEAQDFLGLTEEEKADLPNIIKGIIKNFVTNIEKEAYKLEQEEWLRNHKLLNQCLNMFQIELSGLPKP